jgi:hypothetical protein
MSIRDALFDEEWLDWYRMTPAERWSESLKLWSFYLQVGGSLDPEPDSQSPFDDAFTSRSVSLDGRAGVRLIRRGGI